jgi:transposase
MNKFTKDMGIFVLVSNSESDAIKSLEKYRDKDKVEKCFYNLKNRFDLSTTKVQSEENLESKVFIQTLALTLSARINRVLKENKLIKTYSAFKLIDRFNLIKKFDFSEHNTYYDIITKKQIEIYKMFGVTPPKIMLQKSGR